MRRFVSVLALLVVVTGTGCLTAAGKSVMVTEDREAVRGCKLLKRIRVHYESAPSAGAAENDRRNETAELGGNVYLYISSDRGEAYLCDEAHLAPLREAGPVEPKKD